MSEYPNGRLIAMTGLGAAGWVRVKVKIRVPFNTDLNKMRKAIKKVGEAMQADPELGPMFL